MENKENLQHPSEEEIRKMIADYKDDVSFNDEMGTVSINLSTEQLELVEKCKNMWSRTNSDIYKKFIIPVGGLSKTRAEEEIGQLIADYKDEVSFNDEMGTVSINGSAHIPFKKQLFTVSELPLKNTNLFQKIKNLFTWKK